ncbi:MAG: diaminopimelate epimerase [Actinomycetota bacterium]
MAFTGAGEEVEVAVTLHEGAGNDFIVVVDADGTVNVQPSDAVRACDRTDGIGADGLLRVRRGSETDLTMDLWNADGSIAEMSGNGIRCLAQAAVLAGLTEDGTMTVSTLAGVRVLTYDASDDPAVGSATVTMGPVTLGETLAIAGTSLARRASIGNPHLILVVDDATDIDPLATGPELSRAPREGTNVEWITPRDRKQIDLVVYERGVGPTKACGTGSCAAAVVAAEAGLCDPVVAVHNPGGTLVVDTRNRDDVILGGPVSLLGHFTLTFGSLL